MYGSFIRLLRQTLVITAVLVGAAVLASAQSRHYETIYSFDTGAGGSQNNYPVTALVADGSGNLYGTTNGAAWGAVYELTPSGNGSWTESYYQFPNSGAGGDRPNGLLFLNGNLYGTTLSGGTSQYGGVVYELTPPTNGNGMWTETVLYNFMYLGPDGSSPMSTLIADSQGRLYGTATDGGLGTGTIFMLTSPSQPGGSWTEETIHKFAGGPDGGVPIGGVVMDGSGVLYGTTWAGGKSFFGTVYKLTPPASGQGKWAYEVLHLFAGGADGASPRGSLVIDNAGVLYGTTSGGGSGCPPRVRTGCGTVFQLVPPSNGGGWTENVIYSFIGQQDGAFPNDTLALDASGSLYGTTRGGGTNTWGVVFKLSPPSGGGAWTITTFNVPRRQTSDAGVLLQGKNIYGTTEDGGANSTGSVFDLVQ